MLFVIGEVNVNHMTDFCYFHYHAFTCLAFNAVLSSRYVSLILGHLFIK